MDVVIQCAATKTFGAGSFRAKDGRAVHFVANPSLCAASDRVLHARPDDISDVPHLSWRERLTEYVRVQRTTNSVGLYEAYRLYRHASYTALVERLGVEHLFILSAGWGIIRADYLLPTYDITFNRQAKLKNPLAFCSSTADYSYFQQLPANNSESIYFLGGKDYLPLFETLTKDLQRSRVVFTRMGLDPLKNIGKTKYTFEQRPFRTSASTNWHYLCAKAIATGEIALS